MFKGRNTCLKEKNYRNCPQGKSNIEFIRKIFKTIVLNMPKVQKENGQRSKQNEENDVWTKWEYQ